MNFDVKVSEKDRETFLEMSGSLDEDARLPRLEGRPEALTIDLGGVPLINSMGCRRWVSWINEIALSTPEIRLVRCSHAFIQQMNILGGFLPPRARVVSLFVPYECPRCGHGARVLHACENGFDARSVPEHLTCAACGSEMNLEIVRGSYFRFLNARSA